MKIEDCKIYLVLVWSRESEACTVTTHQQLLNEKNIDIYGQIDICHPQGILMQTQLLPWKRGEECYLQNIIIARIFQNGICGAHFFSLSLDSFNPA